MADPVKVNTPASSNNAPITFDDAPEISFDDAPDLAAEPDAQPQEQAPLAQPIAANTLQPIAIPGMTPGPGPAPEPKTLSGFITNLGKDAGEMFQGAKVIGSGLNQRYIESITPQGILESDLTQKAIAQPNLENFWNAVTPKGIFQPQTDLPMLGAMAGGIVSHFNDHYIQPIMNHEYGKIGDFAYDRPLTFASDVLPFAGAAGKLIGKAGKAALATKPAAQAATAVRNAPIVGPWLEKNAQRAQMADYVRSKSADFVKAALPQIFELEDLWNQIPKNLRPEVLQAGEVRQGIEHSMKIREIPEAKAFLDYANGLANTLAKELNQRGLLSTEEFMQAKYGPFAKYLQPGAKDIKDPAILGQAKLELDAAGIEPNYFGILAKKEAQAAEGLKGGLFVNKPGAKPPFLKKRTANAGAGKRLEYHEDMADKVAATRLLQTLQFLHLEKLFEELAQQGELFNRLTPAEVATAAKRAERLAFHLEELKQKLAAEQKAVAEAEQAAKTAQGPELLKAQATLNRAPEKISKLEEKISKIENEAQATQQALDDARAAEAAAKEHDLEPVQVAEIMEKLAARNGWSKEAIKGFIEALPHKTIDLPKAAARQLNASLGRANNTVFDRMNTVFKRLTLQLDIHWALAQSVQNQFILPFAMFKKVQDIPRSLMSYVLAFDPKVDRMIRTASPHLLENTSARSFAEIASGNMHELEGFMAKQNLPFNAPLAGAISKAVAPIQWYMDRVTMIAGKGDNYARIVKYAHTMLEQTAVQPKPIQQALKDAFSLQARHLQLKEALANPATLELAAQDVYRWLGKYDHLTNIEWAGMRRIIPFWNWWMHSASITMALPTHAPIKTMVLAKLFNVAPMVMQPDSMAERYKEAGAVPILKRDGTPLEDPNGFETVRIGGGWVPITQMPELMASVVHLTQGGSGHEGLPVFHPLASMIVMVTGHDPGSLAPFDNPHDYGNRGDKFNAELEKQTIEPIPLVNMAGRALAPKQQRDIADWLAETYGKLPSDQTTLLSNDGKILDAAIRRDKNFPEGYDQYGPLQLAALKAFKAKPTMMAIDPAIEAQNKQRFEKRARSTMNKESFRTEYDPPPALKGLAKMLYGHISND